MSTTSDATILSLWLNRQRSPHTRSCYRRDVERLLSYVGKPLSQIDLGDLQGFASSLSASRGLAPVSCARTIAAVKSLFGFSQRMRLLPTSPRRRTRYPKLSQSVSGTNTRRRRGGSDPFHAPPTATKPCCACFTWPDCGFPRPANCGGATCKRGRKRE